MQHARSGELLVRDALARVVAGTAAVRARIEAIRPVYFLVPLVGAQWAVTAYLGLTATHNGWLFYHGGDGTYYWTSTWSLAHHRVPEAVISYGLPVILWPVALVFGANMLAALPAVVGFQVLVLAPLGIVALFGLGTRIAGRLFGYAAVVGWILAPLLALRYFRAVDYRPRAHDLVVPNALGLTSLADYTSMILALVATFLVLRAIEDRRWNDVILAGLTAGALIGVKPSNAYYLAAPLVAFAVARRWREGLAFFALLLPALVTLTIWKKTGLGSVPIASPDGTRLALGDAVPTASSLDRYIQFNWDTFTSNLAQLREIGWSLRLLEWAVIAGTVGLVRRAPLCGALVGAWFWSYVIFKGGAGVANVYQVSFFRLTMPAFPAFVLIVLSIVFLVPGVRRRVAPAARPTPPTRLAVVFVAVLAAYPLAVVGTAKAWSANRVVKITSANLLVPVSDELRLKARVRRGLASMTWRVPPHGSSKVEFVFFRSPDSGCIERETGARDCLLNMTGVGTTGITRFDDSPEPGTYTYRVGMISGWRSKTQSSDLLLIGPPLRVRIR